MSSWTITKDHCMMHGQQNVKTVKLCNVNQEIHALQINVLIHFLDYSTCYENRVFVIRKPICTCSFYGMFFVHLCYLPHPSARLLTVIQNSQWPSEQSSFITTKRLPILQLPCRHFWQSITSPRSVSPPTAQIWLSGTSDFSQS